MAWIGALSIGLSLGLLGSGGSILTVPVLVFLIGEGEKVAIAESLAIVGAIAFAGSLPYARRGLVDWRSVLLFGVPGMAGSFAGAAGSAWLSGTTQLALFGFIMLAAAALMLRPPSAGDVAVDTERRVAWKIAVDGMVVGVITGLVGVGGGFLIVPALVLLSGLEIHRAVGTSLTIIALKSATGFVKYLDVLADLQLVVDWRLIAIFVVIGTVGSIAGNWLASRTPQKRLRQVFAVFLVVMGIFVLYSNLGVGEARGATQDEWIQLFNGRDLAGWTPKITGYELGDNFGDTFRVEDGLLRVAYDEYESFDGRFGHLFYEGRFPATCCASSTASSASRPPAAPAGRYATAA